LFDAFDQPCFLLGSELKLRFAAPVEMTGGVGGSETQIPFGNDKR
jgi:hypothetical protein